MAINSVESPNQITWMTNLLRGLRYCIPHLIMPFFKRSEFNYSCLFSRESSCCLQSYKKTEITSMAPNVTRQVDSDVHVTKDYLSDSLEKLKSNVHKFFSRSDPATTISTATTSTRFSLEKHWALVAQLAFCTIVICYHLCKDAYLSFSVIINNYKRNQLNQN